MKKIWGIIIGGSIVAFLSATNPDWTILEKMQTVCLSKNLADIEIFFTETKTAKDLLLCYDKDDHIIFDYLTEEEYTDVTSYLYHQLSQDKKDELLRRCSENGDRNRAQKCLEAGAQIIHEADNPPLILAASNNHLPIIQLFFKHDPTLVRFINTCLGLAAKKKHKKLIAWLLCQETRTTIMQEKSNPDIVNWPQLALNNGHVTTMGMVLPD
ncbi:MAG: hypothetical protein WD068_00895 [Candidatus Babeliales bacterium]